MMPRVASCKLENTNSDVLVSIMQKYTTLLEENQEQKSELEKTRSMLSQYSRIAETGRGAQALKVQDMDDPLQIDSEKQLNSLLKQNQDQLILIQSGKIANLLQ